MVLDTKYNHSYRVLEISPIYLIKNYLYLSNQAMVCAILDIEKASFEKFYTKLIEGCFKNDSLIMKQIKKEITLP